MRNSIKKIALGFVAIGAFALTACMSSGSNLAANDQDGQGTVVLQTRTGNVNKLSKPGLGKASVIQLEKLVITAISNAATPDTVTIELAVGDSGFKDTSTIDQTIAVPLSLKALRTWKITAVTTDVNDSTIHTSDTVTVTNLLAGQTRLATLNVNPEYSMYKATFNFPDSIFSPTGLFGQSVEFSRIEFLVDGVVKADLEAGILPFEADSNYQVAYDYVSVNASNVTLKVYGTISGASVPWDAESVLYEKTVAISSLSTLSVNSVPLDWVGPTGGNVNLTVQIGRVGTYEIEAGMDPIILD